MIVTYAGVGSIKFRGSILGNISRSYRFVPGLHFYYLDFGSIGELPIDSWVIDNHANVTIQSLANDRLIDLVYSVGSPEPYIDHGTISVLAYNDPNYDWGYITRTSLIPPYGDFELSSITQWSVHKAWVGTGQIFERGRGITRLVAPYIVTGTVRVSGAASTFYVPSVATWGILPLRSNTVVLTTKHKQGSGTLSAFSGAAEAVSNVAQPSSYEENLVQISTVSAADINNDSNTTFTNCSYSPNGGTGNSFNGGFDIGSHIRIGTDVTSGLTDITVREVSFNLDLIGIHKITLSAIRGNSSNGGDVPEAGEDLYIQFGSGSEIIIVGATDASFNSLNTTADIDVPVSARIINSPVRIYQKSFSYMSPPSFNVTGSVWDHYGVKSIELYALQGTGDPTVITTLFNVNGSAADSFHVNWNSYGTVGFSGQLVEKHTDYYVGYGSLSTFSGGADTLTKHYTLDSEEIFEYNDYGSITTTNNYFDYGEIIEEGVPSTITAFSDYEYIWQTFSRYPMGDIVVGGAAGIVFTPSWNGRGTIKVYGHGIGKAKPKWNAYVRTKIQGAAKTNFSLLSIGSGTLFNFASADENRTFSWTTTGSIWSWSGAAESIGVKPLETKNLFDITGLGRDSLTVNPPEEGTEIVLSGTAVEKYGPHYHGSGDLPNIGSLVERRTYHYSSTSDDIFEYGDYGSITTGNDYFDYGGIIEGGVPSTIIEFIDYEYIWRNFSNYAMGDITIGGDTHVTFTPSWNGSGTVRVGGTGRARIKPRWVAYVRTKIQGAAKTNFSLLHNGSGVLWNFSSGEERRTYGWQTTGSIWSWSGAAEVIGANPPDITTLFNITGISPTAFTPNWNSQGTIPFTGTAIEKYGPHYHGSGVLYDFSRAEERRVFDYNGSSIDWFEYRDYGSVVSFLEHSWIIQDHATQTIQSLADQQIIDLVYPGDGIDQYFDCGHIEIPQTVSGIPGNLHEADGIEDYQWIIAPDQDGTVYPFGGLHIGGEAHTPFAFRMPTVFEYDRPADINIAGFVVVFTPPTHYGECLIRLDIAAAPVLFTSHYHGSGDLYAIGGAAESRAVVAADYTPSVSSLDITTISATDINNDPNTTLTHCTYWENGGTGNSYNGGFNIGSYIGTGSGGPEREIKLVLDLTGVDRLTIHAIKGSHIASNGGESPDENYDLRIYFGDEYDGVDPGDWMGILMPPTVIVAHDDDTFDSLNTVDVDVPILARVPNSLVTLYQYSRQSGYHNIHGNNFGIQSIDLHNIVFASTTPAGPLYRIGGVVNERTVNITEGSGVIFSGGFGGEATTWRIPPTRDADILVGSAAKTNFSLLHVGSGDLSAIGGAAESRTVVAAHYTPSVPLDITTISATDINNDPNTTLTNCAYWADSGTGTGIGGGFDIGSHIRFGDSNIVFSTEYNQPREVELELDLRNVERITIHAIRGNGINGGEGPGGPTENLYIKFGNDQPAILVAYNDASYNSLNTVEVNVPEWARVRNSQILIVQYNFSTSSTTRGKYDHYGVKSIDLHQYTFTSTTPAGPLYRIGGVGVVRTSADEQGSGVIFSSGFGGEATTWKIPPTRDADIIIGGIVGESFTPAPHIGSGSLKNFSGAAESLTVSPDETQLLFSIIGAIDNPLRTFAEFSSGTIPITGSAYYSLSDVYVGEGVIFSNGFGGESTTIKLPPTREAHILFGGTRQSEKTAVTEVGTGRLWGWGGASVTTSVADILGGLFKIDGVGSITRTRDWVGTGAIFSGGFSGEATTWRIPPIREAHILLGGFATERTSFNPPDITTNIHIFGEISDPLLTFAEQPEVRVEVSGVANTAHVDVFAGEGVIFSGGFGGEATTWRIPPIREAHILLGGTRQSEKTSAAEVGTGRLYGLSGASVTTSINGYSGGLFTIFGYSAATATISEIGDGIFSTFSGAAESTSSIPLTHQVLFSISGLSTYNTTRNEIGDGNIWVDPSALVYYYIPKYPGYCHIKVAGEGYITRTRHWVGEGVIFSGGFGGEATTWKIPPMREAHILFSGTRESEKTTTIEIGEGRLYSLIGEASIQYIPHWTGSGSVEIDGVGYITRTRDWVGEGVIFSGGFGGEATTWKIPPMREAHILFGGSRLAEKTTTIEIGEGRLYGLSGASVTTSVTGISGGLFQLDGIAHTTRTRDFIGTGSLFGIDGAAESFTVIPPEQTTLFDISGVLAEKTTVSEIGYGRLWGWGGSAEALAFSPDEEQVLFYFVGVGVETVAFDTQHGFGRIHNTGEAVINISYSHAGDGNLFSIVAGRESVAYDYVGIGTTQISGFAIEKFVRAPYQGKTEVAINGDASIRVSYDQVGSGVIFSGGFGGEATTWKIPPTRDADILINGNSSNSITKDYIVDAETIDISGIANESFIRSTYSGDTEVVISVEAIESTVVALTGECEVNLYGEIPDPILTFSERGTGSLWSWNRLDEKVAFAYDGYGVIRVFGKGNYNPPEGYHRGHGDLHITGHETKTILNKYTPPRTYGWIV